MNGLFDVFRRVQQLVRVGIIKRVDQSEAMPLYQVQHNEFETHDKLPGVQQYGFVSNPPLESKAVMISLAGDASAKMVIGTIDPESRVKDLAEGEVCIHDRGGNKITLKDGKLIEIEAKSGVMITAPDGITLKADVKIEGTLTATDDVKVGAVSLKSHRHPGVQTGGGVTAPPQ